ncbi:signal peptide protein [Rhodopirellula sp. SWK7]|nr:signal peptide protein [Rhodopirellula sp. SWK7]
MASILLLVLFGADLIMGFAGMQDAAPMQSTSMLMDLAFLIFAGLLAYLSFTTYREQR